MSRVTWDYGTFCAPLTHCSTMQTQPSSGARCLFLVGPFLYFHTSYVQTAKALARLHRCASSPESLLVAYVISTIFSWAGSNNNPKFLDRQDWANSEDSDQTVYTVCQYVCIFSYYSTVKLHCSNFKIITVTFYDVWKEKVHEPPKSAL